MMKPGACVGGVVAQKVAQFHPDTTWVAELFVSVGTPVNGQGVEQFAELDDRRMCFRAPGSWLPEVEIKGEDQLVAGPVGVSLAHGGADCSRYCAALGREIAHGFAPARGRRPVRQPLRFVSPIRRSINRRSGKDAASPLQSFSRRARRGRPAWAS